MSVKFKAGTVFVLPLEFEDDNFDSIEAIEILIKQAETGDTLKSAYWSRDGESRDAVLVDGKHIILVHFSREDSYLFQQEEMFIVDTRIHYYGTDINPYTPLVRVRMSQTLFANGEEVS